MSRNFELLTQVEREMSEREPVASSNTGRDLSRATGDPISGIVSSREGEMRRLVQRVFLSWDGAGPRRVVFFGADAASDSSRVCASAGRVLSASGRVCLVDADIRSGRLASMLSPGEGERVARKGLTPSAPWFEVEPNLYLARLSGVTAHSGELPSLRELQQFFARFDDAFDYVLIDGPDAHSAGDSLVLAAMADGSILVVEAHRTRRLNALTAKEKCDVAGARLLGTVLANRSFPIPERLYRLF